jgi:hypothetical protein
VYLDGSFENCTATAPSGPIHAGACAGLDAHDCARHDSCSAWYRHGARGVMFDRCADEVGASSSVAVDGPGSSDRG